jgi:hypothetical protein
VLFVIGLIELASFVRWALRPKGERVLQWEALPIILVAWTLVATYFWGM